MATVKAVILKEKKRSDNTWNVKIRIIHEKKVSYMAINPSEFSKASQTIDMETDLVLYMIDNIDDKVTTFVSVVGGGIWSRCEGIMFAGNADRIDEELREIEEERQAEQMKTGEKEQKKRGLVRTRVIILG